jgi:hypothetical protein
MRRIAIVPLATFLALGLSVAPAAPVPAAAPSFVPIDLLVDMPGNGVIEPNEFFALAPVWSNQSGSDSNVTGTASNATGPAGATYSISDATADYGTFTDLETTSCFDQPQLDCYLLHVSDPAIRPSVHWDMTVTETLSTGEVKTWTLHIGRTFADVSPTGSFYRSIETIVHDGITAGCNTKRPPWFCPKAFVTRAQMAVFLLRSKEGGSYTPPPVGTPTFADVPASSPYAPWIEELADRGVTAGCASNPRRYCPGDPLTREQMAIFLLRTLLGGGYTPPPVTTPTFADVPASSPYAPWIEDLVDRSILSGCATSPRRFCPTAQVTREQMAILLTRTFDLLLYRT